MYYKQSAGSILVRKSVNNPEWIQWTHHSQGSNCCQECLMLDGCWFPQENAPTWPHHHNCHCTLDPLDYTVVMINSASHADYSKFDPYLFDPKNIYKHGKNRAFESWGYTISDSLFLRNEIEEQALVKYLAGDFLLGKLDKRGQRISIRITIPRKNGVGSVSFLTGWMILPNGQIKLNTPYGGK